MNESQKMSLLKTAAIFLFIKSFTVPSTLFAVDPTAGFDEKTNEILGIFKRLSAIPRCSKNEKQISKWLRKWANENEFDAKSDSKGNVVIRVPATEGLEKAPGIVIQGHMDMVCEKKEGSSHNFFKDPIRFIFEGERLKADDTTLGADNGIGIAVSLAVAKDKTISHPPLELLFTVGEEAGLIGAYALKPNFFKGKNFINIDSEGEGILTVGSAGGKVMIIHLPLLEKELPQEFKVYWIQVAGLPGGHSGMDINKNRGNAIKILANVLQKISRTAETWLVDFEGGTRANAIPRRAKALMAFKPSQYMTVQALISESHRKIQAQYGPSKNASSITLSPLGSGETPKKGVTQKDTHKVINLLCDLPDGVAEMSSDFEDTVETSNNIGTVNLKNKTLTILCFQRSSDMVELDEITSKIMKKASKMGAETKIVGSFSAWTPDLNSPILQRSRKVYKAVFSQEPKIAIVHGGLECSVIGAQYDDLDMIAIGPTIANAHSPEEKVLIPTIRKLWQFLIALLESYKS